MFADQLRYRYACIFFIVVFGAVDVESEPYDACRTVRNEQGVCVPALSCSSIKFMLEMAQKPLPPSVLEILRKSHCGFFNNDHHMCCKPSRVIDSNPETTTKKVDVITPKPGIEGRSSVDISSSDLRTGMDILEAVDCGDSDFDKVGNGKAAGLSEYPWMALLLYNGSGLICGGSLITDQYVLTAAHCIRTGSKYKLVSVRLGEHDIRDPIDCEGIGKHRACAPPLQDIDIREAIYHKDFDRSDWLNDIGLIRLARKATFNSAVQPICLPITELSKSTNLRELIVAGWGRMVNISRANVLQKAVLPVKTNDFCQKSHPIIAFTGSHMCAGAENDIDACKGDSGGPVFYNSRYRTGVKFVQYGIISAGSGYCGSQYPGIFTRLTSYVDWIASNIKP